MNATAPRIDSIQIGDLSEHDPVGVAAPRIGWIVSTDRPDWYQESAELSLSRADGTETHRHASGESVAVEWPFAELSAGEIVHVRVRVTGTDGVTGPWSESRSITAGFLDTHDWVAEPIGTARPSSEAQPVYLRTEFRAEPGLTRATLRATAVGSYQVALNGEDIDDHVLKPGWTPYRDRTVMETTDVTALLKLGGNAIGVRLAGAWATEKFGFRGWARRIYAQQPVVALQLHLEYSDGHDALITTDGSWRTSSGPLLSSSIYDGEHHDARLSMADSAGIGFSEAGFTETGWAPAHVAEPIPAPGVRRTPPIRRTEELGVREILRSPSGRTVLDFGQNLVGRVRIRVSGARGTEIVLRHAEALEHGEIATRPLRHAAATDRYVLRDGGEEVWEPEFTFHGFRYVEVTGWPGKIDPQAIVAVVIHSDMPRTGWFDTSHALLDRLHQNVVWSMRGNFLSLPTDCPQRDERLGWTGDIQVFAPTAASLFDVRGFLASWLVDLEIEQRHAGGVVPWVVPDVLGDSPPTAVWGDAATLVPMTLFQRYADAGALGERYASMRMWLDVVIDLAGPERIWRGGFQFGDWLDPDAPPRYPGKGRTAHDLVATAYLYRSADAVATAAGVLGLRSDEVRYRLVADETRAAFRAEFMTPNCRLSSDSQTAYALAMTFGLAEPDERAKLGDRLAELVRQETYRIGTGFVGTPLVLDALTASGHTDTARRLLTQTRCPSWLYPVTLGATTVWERWDSMLPDGRINPGEMTSFNHYAFGAVVDWMHRVLAGLAPAAPGYRRIAIAPTPLDGIDRVALTRLTPYGRVRVAWERVDEEVRITATIPANTTADVVLADGARFSVGSGEYLWTVALAHRRPERAARSLRSALAEIADDEEAYSRVLDVLEQHDPKVIDILQHDTRWTRQRTLGQALAMPAGPALSDLVAIELDDLSAQRKNREIQRRTT